MAAAFWEGLVFDMKPRDARAFEIFQGMERVQHITVSGIEIADDRNFDRIDHLGQALGDLDRIDHAHIGNAGGTRDAAAGGVDDLCARSLHNARRNSVIGAGYKKGFSGREKFAKFGRGAHRVSPA